MEQATSMIHSISNNGVNNCIDQIFKPAYYCALDKKCLAPPNTELVCRASNKKHGSCNSWCHRFDQSVYNLLVGNYFDFKKTRYTTRGLQWELGNVVGNGKALVKHWYHESDVLMVNRMPGVWKQNKRTFDKCDETGFFFYRIVKTSGNL